MATSLGMGHVHQAGDEIKYIDFENMDSLISHTTGLISWLGGRDVVITCNCFPSDKI